MFMVCVVHVMGPGGVIEGLQGLSLSRQMAAGMLYNACFIAVDCFALISGYVAVGRPARFGNILRFWLQVFFYSGGITLYFALTDPVRVGGEQVLGAFFPVLTEQYWYVTAYMGLLFLAPVLNAGLAALTRRQKGMLTVGILLLFSLSRGFFREVFDTDRGYSAMWLILLYLIGGCLKELTLKPWQAWLCLLLYPIGVYGIRLAGEYIAFGNVVASIGLLLFMAHLRLPAGLARWISRLGPLAFGVYLIHAFPLIYKYSMYYAYSDLAQLRAPAMIAGILLASARIFLPCLLVDAVRAQLFRLLRINALCRWVDGLPDRLLDALAARKKQAEEV